jgi:alkanesulfonate monooxygenase SsuD/methylene tetrahydromethanopterin reductase-like flavin-dependent oxidoreductase (luciferase family)
MKFGTLITPVWGRETDPQIQFKQHQEVVKLASQLGFEAMVAGQHFLGNELRYYQPVPYLTYMNRFAPEMDVVIGLILLSLVNPVELAEQVATLDAVTGGRAVLCVGLGYSDHEFRAFGIPREMRIKRFEEGLNLIKALWSGEEIEFRGEVFNVDRILPAVQPVRKPRPPIWIGGQGEKAIRRAARMADAWYTPPFPTHEGLARLRQIFLEERALHGLPLDGAFPVRRELVLGSSRADARRKAVERSRARYDIYLKWGLKDRLDQDSKGLGSQADEDIDARFILGEPEDVAEQLNGLREELGMTHFMFKPQWVGMPHETALQDIETFGTKVIPLLLKAERA